MQLPLLLLRLDPRGAAFPPGRRFSPQQFWCAAPSTQDSNPVGAYHDGPRRPAADFVASGEARMLAWSPPPGAQYVEPHADAQSLVRFLGGLSTAKAGDEPSVGDVVYRVANGSLAMRWPLVFSRLDPFVRNGIQPIIVLDNVPWAFAASNESRSVGYGNNMGPQNVTEYKEFLQVLLQGMVTRYGLHVAQTFWFRVGTEPDTQPKHWNDTNDKFVEMYVAVATVVAAVIPGAKVGPANFAADGPTRAESWASVVVPIVEGINASGARIDYLAISSYGRATMCDEWKEWKGGEERGGRTASTPMGGGLGLDLPPLQRRVDPKCAYSMAEMAETAERLTSLLPLLSPDARGLPLQAYVMEYGAQQNKLGRVDSQPGAWGGAWTLASSIQLARSGIERAFHWGYGDRSFGNGRTICAKLLSPCGLYGGNIWTAAAAGHLFAAGDATILHQENGTNSTPARAPDDGGVSASGIGGWGAGGELRLLVTLFDPRKDRHDLARVAVTFDRPAEWSRRPRLSRRTMLLNRSTSVYDAIFRNASAGGILLNASDPNVYTLKHMLTKAGVARTEAAAERWLTMQNSTFSPSEWSDEAEDNALEVKCDNAAAGKCSVTLVATPPTVVALWLRPSTF